MSASEALYKSFHWKAIHFFLSLLTTVAVANILKPVISAAFYSLIYLFSLISVFFTLGLDISLNYFIIKKQISPAWSAMVIIIIVIIAVLISAPILYYYQPSIPVIVDRKEVMLLGSLHIAGNLFTTLCGSILTAFNKNHIGSKINIVFSSVVLLGIFLINEYLQNYSVAKTLFYIWFAISFIQGICFFFYTHYIFKVRSDTTVSSHFAFSGLIRFSLAVFVINIIFMLSGRLPLLLLPYKISAFEVGNYIQAYKLLEYVNTVVTFIYLPVISIAAAQKEKSEKAVLFLVRIFNTITITLVLVSVIAGKFLFPAIFGSEFTLMYAVFICMIPALISSSSSAFFTAYFFGRGFLKYNLISALVLFGSVSVLFFPLTHYFSIEGAAIAVSLSGVLSLITDIVLFKRFYNYKPHELFFVKPDDIRMLTYFFNKKSQTN